MLEQINTMINSQCQDKGLRYECRVISQVDDDYIGDAMKLKQVIINMLGNAVKFTPEGGSVTFTVECISRFGGQSALRFTMRDTGVGMDAAYLPRIFDPFSQEDAGRSNRYGSTGLGMAITKSIVEQMNGTIAVESEKGVGTTFTVEVTLRDCERRERQLDAVRAQDLRVLVIDDDPVSREHARNVLEEIGIAADTAATEPEAIEMIQLKVARHEAYNLMFVDWKMPGQNGMEVTKQIRGLVGQDPAMIVLTAYDWDDYMHPEDRKRYMDVMMPLLSGGAQTYDLTYRVRTVKGEYVNFRAEGATFVVLSDTLTRDEVAAIYDHIRYQLQRGIQVNGIKNILTAGGGMISSVGTEVSASTVYTCMNYAYEESRRHKHGDLVDFSGSVNYDGTEALELINTIRESAVEGCRGFELESGYFIDTLQHYLRATGFPPPQLSLKYDDGCRFIGMERLKSIIQALHARGILTIIEDFGSGSDSIGFLRSEPVDAVSINSQLSRDIETDARARNTLDYLTRMAAEYVKHINVKGIRSSRMRDIVRGFSVTTLQGSGFSDSLSLDALIGKYDQGGAES